MLFLPHVFLQVGIKQVIRCAMHTPVFGFTETGYIPKSNTGKYRTEVKREKVEHYPLDNSVFPVNEKSFFFCIPRSIDTLANFEILLSDAKAVWISSLSKALVFVLNVTHPYGGQTFAFSYLRTPMWKKKLSFGKKFFESKICGVTLFLFFLMFLL